MGELFLVALLISVLLLFFGKRKHSGLILIVAITILWGSSLPVVAESLMGSLERSFSPIALTDVPQADCIILLGGGVAQPPRKTGLKARPGKSIGRLNKALELQQAGKAKQFIVAAGGLTRKTGRGPEAVHIRELMVGAGVPEQDILLEKKSTNTWENALYSKEIVDSAGCNLSLLVTSASHMTRAVRAFERAGVVAFPVPADPRAIGHFTSGIDRFIPSQAALKMAQDASHEWAGRVFYQLRGWN